MSAVADPAVQMQMDAEQWNAWRKASPGPLVVQASKFEKRNFAHYDLTDLVFQPKVQFIDVTFVGAGLDRASFTECSFVDTQFGETPKLTFNTCYFTRADFPATALASHVFTGGELRECTFPLLKFNPAPFHAARLIACRVKAIGENCSLAGVDFDACQFADCRFAGADLSGTLFKDCHFTRVNFLQAIFDAKTRFDGATIEEQTVISRYQLEMFKTQGFPRAQWPAFTIEDPVAEFRGAFSGFMQYVHVAALGFFLFPYLFSSRRNIGAPCFIHRARRPFRSPKNSGGSCGPPERMAPPPIGGTCPVSPS